MEDVLLKYIYGCSRSSMPSGMDAWDDVDCKTTFCRNSGDQTSSDRPNLSILSLNTFFAVAESWIVNTVQGAAIWSVPIGSVS